MRMWQFCCTQNCCSTKERVEVNGSYLVSWHGFPSCLKQVTMKGRRMVVQKLLVMHTRCMKRCASSTNKLQILSNTLKPFEVLVSKYIWLLRKAARVFSSYHFLFYQWKMRYLLQYPGLHVFLPCSTKKICNSILLCSHFETLYTWKVAVRQQDRTLSQGWFRNINLLPQVELVSSLTQFQGYVPHALPCLPIFQEASHS